jgi:hypothetical protein
MMRPRARALHSIASNTESLEANVVVRPLGRE